MTEATTTLTRADNDFMNLTFSIRSLNVGA